MIQKIISSILLVLFLLSSSVYAEPVISNTSLANFSRGVNCAKSADLECAKLQLGLLASQSSLAQVLDGAVAVQEGDADRALRLLLPLKANSDLPNGAASSLHASLALAYESIGDTLRALNAYVTAGKFITSEDAKDVNQSAIWELLASQSEAGLIELRGLIDETNTQGWVDLAIAHVSHGSIDDWRNLYPDHPVSDFLLDALATNAADSNEEIVSDEVSVGSKSMKIGLLLPFGEANYYPVADAIERGFSAAKAAANDASEMKIYSTTGHADSIVGIYQQAVNDGMNYIIGPLARNEVTALSAASFGTSSNAGLPLPTLALNQAQQHVSINNMQVLSLSVDDEARQLARIGRDSQLQTALIVTTDVAIAQRMSQMFEEAWTAEGGQVLAQIVVSQAASLEEIQAQLTDQPLADMILLACDTKLARMVRPFLSITTPTFAYSHIYSGVNFDPQDQALLAVRFIDMPWMLDAGNSAFSAYKTVASDLPQGQMQRWFALGVDAYQVSAEMAKNPTQSISFQGLTGDVEISPEGVLTRELSQSVFSANGVVLESAQ